MECRCIARIRDRDGRLLCFHHGDVTDNHLPAMTEAEARLNLWVAHQAWQATQGE
jgi:hypothetical protein